LVALICPFIQRAFETLDGGRMVWSNNSIGESHAEFDLTRPDNSAGGFLILATQAILLDG
jgi:hypothetical protein